MTTECSQQFCEFLALNQRQVVGRFERGVITPDAGGLLLREVEKPSERDHRAFCGLFSGPSGGYPYAELFAQACARLRDSPALC